MRSPFAQSFAPSRLANFAAILIAVLFAFACQPMARAAGANQMLTVSTGQGPRQAIVLPAPKAGPNPTIVILHGATMSAQRMIRSSGFVEAAAAHGFTAVFPESKEQRWNDVRGGGRAHVDDIGFLNALARELIERKIADPQHLYLVGLSSGGMLALTLACDPQTPFVGVATIVASMPSHDEQSCRPPKPMTFIMMNGTADPLLPFGGGKVGFFGRRGTVLGVRRAADILAKAEGCTGKAQQTLPKRDAADKTTVKLVTWTGCTPQASVKLYEVEGGGHQIPGGPTFVPFLFGSPNHDIRAASEILQAFSGS